MKHKVMIVDDDANNRLLLETTLVKAGYDVTSYSNGYELLAILPENLPDAIVTDINMPEIDGYDLLKKIKKSTGSRVPVIFLTARFSDIESRIKGYEFGVHDYITIPYDNNELKARIQNVIISSKNYSENQKKLEDLLAKSEKQRLSNIEVLNDLNTTSEKLKREVKEHKKAEKKLRKNHLQLTMLSHHLQNAREEQSAYIAREIHDDLGQELTALEMLLTLFEDELDKQNVNNHKIIDIKKELRSQLNSVVEKSRKIVLNLRPAIMDTYKLIGSINWLTEQIKNRFEINIEKDFMPEEIDLGDEKNLAVFRIIQEAFNNITKHSNARNVVISISTERKFLNITIKDDGIGFEKNKVEKMNSFGLMSMQERAIYCGGEMKIASKKGNGTLLEFIIPKKEIK